MLAHLSAAEELSAKAARGEPRVGWIGPFQTHLTDSAFWHLLQKQNETVDSSKQNLKSHRVILGTFPASLESQKKKKSYTMLASVGALPYFHSSSYYEKNPLKDLTRHPDLRL